MGAPEVRKHLSIYRHLMHLNSKDGIRDKARHHRNPDNSDGIDVVSAVSHLPTSRFFLIVFCSTGNELEIKNVEVIPDAGE
jgi:hypothetical protein